jgi:hypothetical protein
LRFADIKGYDEVPPKVNADESFLFWPWRAETEQNRHGMSAECVGGDEAMKRHREWIDKHMSGSGVDWGVVLQVRHD